MTRSERKPTDSAPGDGREAPSNRTEPPSNRRRVHDAVARLLDADANDNSHLYFRASDLTRFDADLSPAAAGTHLSSLAADSPLADGLIVEQYTERRCGASLWLVRRDDADERPR